MRLPFRKKIRPELDKLKDLDIRLQNLNTQFQRIEEYIERLGAKSPQITIENVHIHQPVFEKIEYRLDQLDIEQLSGSLNLGNNFGAKMGSGASSAPSDNDTQTAPPATAHSTNPSEPVLHRTPSGFRVLRR